MKKIAIVLCICACAVISVSAYNLSDNTVNNSITENPVLDCEYANNEEPVETLQEDPYYEYEYIETDDFLKLKYLMDYCTSNMNTAHELAECARKLGYKEDSAIINHARYHYDTNKNMRDQYMMHYYALLPEQTREYPIATYIWKYLKSQGYNDYVCAGIIGNMMVECAGQDLNLNPYVYSPDKGFYGICQWSKTYSSNIHGATLDEQLEYLMSDIKYQIDTFGYAYKKNFNYEQFTQLTSASEAGEAFADCYERGDHISDNVRKRCAEKAYEYFVGE